MLKTVPEDVFRNALQTNTQTLSYRDVSQTAQYDQAITRKQAKEFA